MRLRRIDGFTLIELVACIVILAVLAAIAGPRFLSNTAFSEHGYASEVASALRAARQVAVNSDSDVLVVIDVAGGYRALQHAAPGNTCTSAGGWTVPVMLSNGSTLAGTPPAGVMLTPAIQIIFCGGNGQAVGAVPLTVGATTINVAAGSGFVSTP